MEYLPFQLSWLLTGAFITLLGFVLLLNIFGLPANWILLGLTALWKMAHPSAGNLDIWFWVMMIGLALVGEALELGVQVLNARRHGSSSFGTFAGMIGAIAGAILLAPLFFGLGALIGALAGAWTGCFVTELLIRGMPLKTALDAAFGAMMGRFLGTVCKCGVGGGMLALTAGRIWPRAMPPLSPDSLDGPTQVMLLLSQNI
ncbi:MAG: DUF456 domain-containing protein [Desulfovibrio sp.]|jgi:uncharacterized protein YqgC (DUF456 family)|nr:DUF456 domain-containing protein [Desulfovibrio sp.]